TPPKAPDLPEREQEIVISADGYATLSGEVKNWLTLGAAADVALETVGMAPPASATSSSTGSYEMDVLVAGVFLVRTSAPGAVATYELVRMPQGDYPGKTLYLVQAEQLEALAAAYGVTRNDACGTVLVEVKGPTG